MKFFSNQTPEEKARLFGLIILVALMVVMVVTAFYKEDGKSSTPTPTPSAAAPHAQASPVCWNGHNMPTTDEVTVSGESFQALRFPGGQKMLVAANFTYDLSTVSNGGGITCVSTEAVVHSKLAQ